MTILVDAKGFSGAFAGINRTGQTLPVSVADVVRAATTVGGPVEGATWQKTQRRLGIIATVLAALSEISTPGSIGTSMLYRRLETTEKSGVSFRLGMAFAAVVAERILAISLLEHLNQSNSILYPSGGKRRADLFGFDSGGNCHVIEAKARTHGYDHNLVTEAKSQAANIRIVDVASGQFTPQTRSASIADLSQGQVRVLLIDPPEKMAGDGTYRIDTDRVIAEHYSVVPDLLALQEEEPSPSGVDADVIGTYLPGTDIWLGVHRDLLGESRVPWRKRVEQFQKRGAFAGQTIDSETVSHGNDGHVLQLGPRFSQIYDAWRTAEEEGRRVSDGEE